MVQRSALTTNDRRGTVTPTVYLKWVEVVFDEDDVKAIRELMDKRYAQRLGRNAPEDLFTTAEGEPYDPDADEPREDA
jgi:hypothetical protein